MSNNNWRSSLLRNDKEKTVQTAGFLIQGHLLRWENVAIPIDNISMVSSSEIPAPKFPLWAIIVGLIGLCLFAFNTLLAIICVLVSVCVIGFWYKQYKEFQSQMCLNIMLDSVYTFSLIADNIDFVNEIVNVFSNIFRDGSGATVTYYINMKECKIDNNSSVVSTK